MRVLIIEGEPRLTELSRPRSRRSAPQLRRGQAPLDTAQLVGAPPPAIKARVLAAVTRLVAVLLAPATFCGAPGRARFLACKWALGLRFPREDLCGLAPEALTAFTRARAEAFWRDGQLIGLTSGYRDVAETAPDLHRGGAAHRLGARGAAPGAAAGGVQARVGARARRPAD